MGEEGGGSWGPRAEGLLKFRREMMETMSRCGTEEAVGSGRILDRFWSGWDLPSNQIGEGVESERGVKDAPPKFGALVSGRTELPSARSRGQRKGRSPRGAHSGDRM